MNTSITDIALVEDDPILGETLHERLELEGFSCDHYGCATDALAGLEEKRYRIILSDIRLPDGSGESLFDAVRRRLTPPPPMVFITGYGSIEQAVRLLHQGAADYLTKPLDLSALLGRLRELLAHTHPAPTADDMVVPGLRPFFQQIPKLAPHRELVVLIQGESGVGKEILARHLHERLEPGTPFVAVNCAALPDQLAASELFGHEKGAFTGALRRHAGAFERAGRGVLFLDEIGDMPLELQSQLLRVIQDRRFRRIGGEQEMAFEGRLVCATHRDLQALVRQERFREDLYYRLNVVQFEIPPLRKRPADILWLAEQFVRENAARVGRHPPPAIDQRTRNALLAHTWPGNVRELKNLIDRACIFCDGDALTPELLGLPEGGPGGLKKQRQDAERETIRQALRLHDGRIQQTAAALGISRKTLWEKMKKLGIRRDEL